jgi:hypothetical protein
MPKCIDVKLAKIVCDRNGFGGSIQLTGNIFGATFQNNPDSPNDQTSRKGIFPFPGGPITISKGQPAEIEMENSVTFCLSTPTTEPPGLDPRFLKIGCDLNNDLGGSFFVKDNLIQLPITGELETEPREKDLVFSSPNLQITLRFGLSMQHPF